MVVLCTSPVLATIASTELVRGIHHTAEVVEAILYQIQRLADLQISLCVKLWGKLDNLQVASLCEFC